MADAPERIWAFLYTGSRVKGEFQTTSISWGTEYIPADIAASQLAEARAKEETWHKLYQQALDRENAITTERDRLAAALTEIAGDVDGTWDEKFRAVQSVASAALAAKE